MKNIVYFLQNRSTDSIPEMHVAAAEDHTPPLHVAVANPCRTYAVSHEYVTVSPLTTAAFVTDPLTGALVVQSESKQYLY